MNHGSLFNGIGGFQLAAEWVGWKNILSCEIDEWCNKITKQHFKDCIQHGDITKTDFTIYRGQINVLSGGDPCQPHSIAGLGKGETDDRFLWPQMLRASKEAEPCWIVNENVTGSVSNGVIDIKISDLENIGYSCETYYIPAEAVGGLHQRERIWLVAYNANFNAANRITGRFQDQATEQRLQKRNGLQHSWEPVNLRVSDTHSDIERQQEQHFSGKPEIQPERLSRYFGFGAYAHGNIKRDEIESGITRMLNGLPEGMDYDDRNRRIKALGNAIVPQVAYEIFKAIEQMEQTNPLPHQH